MDASKLHDRADDAIKKKNFDYAIDLLKNQILTIYPDDTKARKLLRGCVKLKHKELGAPSSLSAQFASLVPAIKIKIAKMRKKWDNVMQECENVLLNNPADKKAIFSLAIAAGNAGYTQTAIQEHESCLHIDSRYKESLRALGYLYEAQEEYQKAFEYFQKVTQIDPTDGEAARKVKEISAKETSRTYSANNEKGGNSRNLVKDDAKREELELDVKILRTEAEFTRAIEITQKKIADGEPHPDRLHRRIGEIYRNWGKLSEALASFEESFKLNPTSFDVSVAIGDVKIAQLEAKYKKLKKAADGGDADAAAKAEPALKKVHDFKINEYTRRVKEHPTDPDKRYFLGQVLFEAGRYEDAIEHLQKGSDSPQFKKDSANLVGQAFLKTGEPNLAIKAFKKVLQTVEKSDKTGMPIRYNLACALESNGEVDEALKEFESLLEMDVNYKDVKKKLNKIRK